MAGPRRSRFRKVGCHPRRIGCHPASGGRSVRSRGRRNPPNRALGEGHFPPPVY